MCPEQSIRFYFFILHWLYSRTTFSSWSVYILFCFNDKAAVSLWPLIFLGHTGSCPQPAGLLYVHLSYCIICLSFLLAVSQSVGQGRCVVSQAVTWLICQVPVAWREVKAHFLSSTWSFTRGIYSLNVFTGLFVMHTYCCCCFVLFF